jgi:hypothetical protein
MWIRWFHRFGLYSVYLGADAGGPGVEGGATARAAARPPSRPGGAAHRGRPRPRRLSQCDARLRGCRG